MREGVCFLHSILTQTRPSFFSIFPSFCFFTARYLRTLFSYQFPRQNPHRTGWETTHKHKHTQTSPSTDHARTRYSPSRRIPQTWPYAPDYDQSLSLSSHPLGRTPILPPSFSLFPPGSRQGPVITLRRSHTPSFYSLPCHNTGPPILLSLLSSPFFFILP